MNKKNKKFCEYYAEYLNATEAAKKAGYSDKTAYSQGNRLLKNAECQNYIRELQAQDESERIAGIREIKTTWTALMRDKNQKARDRIRAGELLAKSAGEFLTAAPAKDTAQDADADNEPETSRSPSPYTTTIYLPAIEGSDDYNAVQLPNGDIVPLQDCDSDVIIYLPRGEWAKGQQSQDEMDDPNEMGEPKEQDKENTNNEILDG